MSMDALAAIQQSLARLGALVAKLSVRIDALERARRRDRTGGGGGGTTRLADLLDVAEVAYDPPEDRPNPYDLLGFVPDDTSEIGGWWRAIAGRPLIAPDPFTVTDPGLISIDKTLDTLPDWPEADMWEVTATAIASGGTPGIGETIDYEDPFLVTLPAGFALPVTIPSGTTWGDVSIDGAASVPIEFTADTDTTFTVTTATEIEVDPATFDLHRPPPVLRLLLDGVGAVTEIARSSSAVQGSDLALTSSWLFAGGVPRVRASLSVDTDDYPGSHTLTVIVRAWPIPAAPPVEETP